MEISIKSGHGYVKSDCVECQYEEICKIYDAARKFPIYTELKFDCPYIKYKEGGL